jgi:hypothetical protein
MNMLEYTAVPEVDRPVEKVLGLPAVGRSVCIYKFHEFGNASEEEKICPKG